MDRNNTMKLSSFVALVLVVLSSAAYAYIPTPAPDKLAGWCKPAGTRVDDTFSYLGKYDHSKGENVVHWFKVTRTFETAAAVQTALKSEGTSEEDKAAIRRGTAESRAGKGAAGFFFGAIGAAVAESAGVDGSFTCEDGQVFVLAVPVSGEQEQAEKSPAAK